MPIVGGNLLSDAAYGAAQILAAHDGLTFPTFCTAMRKAGHAKNTLACALAWNQLCDINVAEVRGDKHYLNDAHRAAFTKKPSTPKPRKPAAKKKGTVKK
jgi:hypothetical protein